MVRPAVREVVAAEVEELLRKFDPHQPRDPEGKWSLIAGLAKRLTEALTGQYALDASPARLEAGPNSHGGDYAGEKLFGPPGMGAVRALSEYEGVEYQNINAVLRNQVSAGIQPWHTPEQVKEFTASVEESKRKALARVAEIDKTMAVSRLQNDVRVERAIRHGRQVFGDAWYGDVVDWNTNDFDLQDRQIERWKAGERPNLTGLRWKDPGYVSTTASPTVAPLFGRRWPGINSELEGEPVIMTILAPKGTGGIQLSGMDKEAEILLERGLTYEVMADNGVDGQGFRRLDVRVVPDGD